MEIKVTIEAPGLEGAILTFAQVLAGLDLPQTQTKVEVEKPKQANADKPAEKAEEKKEDPVKEAPKKEPVKEEKDKPEPQLISLEVVRGKLAEFSTGGKENQVKVKEALSRLGVTKLTDVDQEDYKELLELVGIVV